MGSSFKWADPYHTGSCFCHHSLMEMQVVFAFKSICAVFSLCSLLVLVRLHYKYFACDYLSRSLAFPFSLLEKWQTGCGRIRSAALTDPLLTVLLVFVVWCDHAFIVSPSAQGSLMGPLQVESKLEEVSCDGSTWEPKFSPNGHFGLNLKC